MKRKKEFDSLIQQCLASPKVTPGLTLTSYLITPVQRIPRYILLLKVGGVLGRVWQYKGGCGNIREVWQYKGGVWQYKGGVWQYKGGCDNIREGVAI